MAMTRRDALALMSSTLGIGALSACSQGTAPTSEGSSTEEQPASVQQTVGSAAHDVETRIAQGRHNVRAASKPFDPLTLLHISDIHGDAENLGRALAWANAHNELIDDILATGDLTHLQFSDGMRFWEELDGAERILTCVGNHDVCEDFDTRLSYDKQSIVEAAAQYIDAFADNWGDIDHKAGTTWYAKDYPERKVRLIVLDCMVYEGVHSAAEAAAQNAWLEERLADAREAGRTVIIAEHYPLADESMVECSWAPFDRKFAYGPFLASDVPKRVQAFIEAGGIFACYLCGHCNCDAAHILPNHPEQFALTVPCIASIDDQYIWGDMDRSQEGTRDAFNLILIDTVNGLVKAIRIGADRDLALQKRTTLCWDYRRNRLVHAD